MCDLSKVSVYKQGDHKNVSLIGVSAGGNLG